MKQESISKLQRDLDLLIDKHSQFIEKNDFGSALNVMKNIDILTHQLKEINYETKVSKFTIPETDSRPIGDETRLISIWKQNAFGDIKDVETYYLGKRYEECMGDVLNKLSQNWDAMSKEMKNSLFEIFKRDTELIDLKKTNS